MFSQYPRHLILNGCLLALSLVVAAQLPAQDSKPVERKFAHEINSAIEMTAGGKTHKITNATDRRYSWLVNPAEKTRTLTLEQTGSRVMMDGKMTQNAVVNRFGSAYVDEKGKTLETKIEDADEKIKTMLTDSYGPPICVLKVDDHGNVVKEQIITKPGAKEQVDTGIIATCSLFHSPYYSDKVEWEHKTSISLGNGGYAIGTLKFARVKDFDPAQPRFTVQGKASNAKYVWKDDPKMSSRDVQYDISGEQTYDPALGEWTSGTLTMKVYFTVFSEETLVGTHKGSMVFKVKLVTE